MRNLTASFTGAHRRGLWGCLLLMASISLRLPAPRVRRQGVQMARYGNNPGLLLKRAVLRLRVVATLLLWQTRAVVLNMRRRRRIAVVAAVGTMCFLGYRHVRVVLVWVLDDDVPCVEKPREESENTESNVDYGVG
jgi:hypothetical protein